MQRTTPLEAVLRRDRAVVLASVLGVVVLAWAYILYLARGMNNMNLVMHPMEPWGGVDFLFRFGMWAVMMIAMMVPTAAPMILLFATVNRRRREQRQPFVPTGVFLAGYVVVWSGFAALATLAMWGLHSAALLSPLMVSASPLLGGALLVAAGIYQWSPLKRVCLTQCRTPLGFLMSEWGDGTAGALRMGLRHGSYCVGCCWVLMGLLFVTRVMNLLWVAAIAAFVLVEKVAPAGPWLSRVTGVLLAGGGAWVVARALA